MDRRLVRDADYARISTRFVVEPGRGADRQPAFCDGVFFPVIEEGIGILQ